MIKIIGKKFGLWSQKVLDKFFVLSFVFTVSYLSSVSADDIGIVLKVEGEVKGKVNFAGAVKNVVVGNRLVENSWISTGNKATTQIMLKSKDHILLEEKTSVKFIHNHESGRSILKLGEGILRIRLGDKIDGLKLFFIATPNCLIKILEGEVELIYSLRGNRTKIGLLKGHVRVFPFEHSQSFEDKFLYMTLIRSLIKKETVIDMKDEKIKMKVVGTAKFIEKPKKWESVEEQRLKEWKANDFLNKTEIAAVVLMSYRERKKKGLIKKKKKGT